MEMESIASATTNANTNGKTESGAGGGGVRFGSSTTAVPIFNNLSVKIPKQLSENKLKRLNILTFINSKKEILFTKKASKFEKERVWRQIFQKMLDFGMVTPQRDWRYVRDVSFSNWRKRAQKRIKHLAATGQKLNMDECEFLIYDILGHSPDKNHRTRTRGAVPLGEVPALLEAIGGGVPCPELPPPPPPSAPTTTAGVAMNSIPTMAGTIGSSPLNSSSNFEDESDEYMIDSDEDAINHANHVEADDDEDEDDEDDDEDEEDDDEDELFENMKLFIPKIVFDEDPGPASKMVENTNSKLKQQLLQPQYHQIKIVQPKKPQTKTIMVNGYGHDYNHLHQASGRVRPSSLSQYSTRPAKPYQVNRIKLENDGLEMSDTTSLEDSSTTNNNAARCLAKVRELKLLELEIENKRLKNRFMKLKVWSMERSLGLEHSKEVREIGEALVKIANNNSNMKRSCGH